MSMYVYMCEYVFTIGQELVRACSTTLWRRYKILSMNREYKRTERNGRK